MDSPGSTSYVATGALGYRCVCYCVQFYMALGNLDSGPHACTPSPFLISFPKSFPILGNAMYLPGNPVPHSDVLGQTLPSQTPEKKESLEAFPEAEKG